MSFALLLFSRTLWVRRSLSATIGVALLAWCLASVAYAGNDRRFSCTPEFIPDGDTIHCADGRKVRLMGLDAPEAAHGDASAQYYSAEATAFLRKLVQGKRLLVVAPNKARDRYGRWVAEVYLPGALDNAHLVNRKLVKNGLAFVLPHDDVPSQLLDGLLRAQREAMEQGRGFWARILSLPDPPGGWIGNRSSARFHAADCRDVQRMARRNRMPFATRRDAFFFGFAPARSCARWPVVP